MQSPATSPRISDPQVLVSSDPAQNTTLARVRQLRHVLPGLGWPVNRIFVKTVDGQEVDESEIPPGEANTEMNVWIQSGEANHNAAEVVASLRQLRGRDSSAAAEAFVALMQRVTEGTPAQTYEAIAHGGIVTQAIASALESLRL